MRAALLSLVSLVACSSKPGPATHDSRSAGDTHNADTDTAVEEGLVLSHDGWRLADPSEDPFPPETTVDCPAVAFGPENGFFELETDLCAWATFHQATRMDLSAGDPLRVVTWHLDLWAQEPTHARIVLRLDDENVWEAKFDIPGDEDVAELLLDAPSDLPAGSDAWFHIANHGVNSWRLGDVERQPR